MVRPLPGCSVLALLLLACSPATGGLGTAFSGEESETDAGAGDESGGNEMASADGDGDPDTNESGDGDPSGGDGDGDPGPMSECGNGIIEEGEDCEGDDFGGATCMDYGFVGGDMGCTGSCMHDITKCWNDPCGNDVKEQGEDCDGTITDTDCIDLQLGPGMLMCNPDCTFDTSDCGIEGEGESCGIFNDPCPDDQLNCVAGKCWDGSFGDDCSDDSDCLSGMCDKGWLEAVGECL